MSLKTEKEEEPKEDEKNPLSNLPVAIFTMKQFPGVSTVMRNMESISGGLCRFHEIVDNDITKIHRDFLDADKVILGGWNPELFPQLCMKRNNVSIMLCSSLGQMELSIVEPQFLNQIISLKKRGHVSSVIVGSSEVFMAYYYSVDNMTLMPYPIELEEFAGFDYNKKTFADVGLFMPSHGRKNIMNQIYGTILADLRMKQENRIESITLKTNNDINTTVIKVDKLGWLDRKKYLKKLKQLKVGLHVTFTESFGYGALDYMLVGVPVLVSTTVAYNLELPSTLNNNMMVINCDSAREISEKIYNIITMKEEEYKHLSMSVRVHAKNLAIDKNSQFLSWLSTFISKEKPILK